MLRCASIAILAIVLLAGAIFASDAEGLSKQEIKQMMSSVMTLDDLEDEGAIAKWRQIIALGSDAHPALAELLEDAQEPVAISRILAVFVESEGDKSVAVKATKDLLARSKGDKKEKVRTRSFAADALGKIGKADDGRSLYPLLADSNERVRINAIRALAQLGDQHTLERIENFLADKQAKLSKEDQEKDYSVREARKAIETIRDRLAKAKKAAEQDKTDP